MVRRLLALAAGVLAALLPVHVATAQGCSPSPCRPPGVAAGAPGPGPVAVSGVPPGNPARTDVGVLDDRSGTVVPLAVATGGLVIVGSALGMAIRRHRQEMAYGFDTAIPLMEAVREG